MYFLLKNTTKNILLVVIMAIFVVATANAQENVLMEKISFKSGDNRLQGLLFTPQEQRHQYPAITLIGPVASVKEQAPIEYAKRLAARGFKTIVFDPTSHGDSEGQPRRFESGEQKTQDIQASVSYLNSLTDVDQQNIYGLAICQGVNWMIKAANQDQRLKSIALVAGHYLTPSVAEHYTGSKINLQQRLEKAQLAKNKYQQTGAVEYIPIVSLKDKDALLLHKAIYDWYIPWETNQGDRQGKWENRITRMSELDIWGSNIKPHMEKLQQPTLLIHSDRAATGSEIPKQLFTAVKANEKKLTWFEDQIQMQFYDDPKTINRAVSHIEKWFKQR